MEEDGDANLITVMDLENNNAISHLQSKPKPLIILSDGEDDDLEVNKPIKFPYLKTEAEHSSFVCQICSQPKPQSQSFSIKGCTHRYCTECMTKYVSGKIQESNVSTTSVTCPDQESSNCLGVLEPDFCRDRLPKEVLDRWGDALCESLILGIHRVYCPFKDCSALLIDEGGVVVRQSICPHCHRLFCAQCKVAWHVGVQCEEFIKKLGEGGSACI